MDNDGLSLGLGIGDITDCGVCPNLGIVPKELQMVNVFNYFSLLRSLEKVIQ